MHKHKEELENIFKKKLDTYEVPPPVDAWERISSRITPVKKSTPNGFLIAVTVTLSILLFTPLLIWLFNHTENTPPTSNTHLESTHNKDIKVAPVNEHSMTKVLHHDMPQKQQSNGFVPGLSIGNVHDFFRLETDDNRVKIKSHQIKSNTHNNAVKRSNYNSDPTHNLPTEVGKTYQPSPSANNHNQKILFSTSENENTRKEYSNKDPKVLEDVGEDQQKHSHANQIQNSTHATSELDKDGISEMEEREYRSANETGKSERQNIRIVKEISSLEGHLLPTTIKLNAYPSLRIKEKYAQSHNIGIFTAEIYGGSGIGFNRYEIDDRVLAEKKRNNESIVMSFSSGIVVGYQWNNGLAVKTGLQHTFLKNRVNYYNPFHVIKEPVIEEVLTPQGVIYDTISHAIVGQYSTKQYTTFEVIDMPVLIGYFYRINDYFSVEIEAGPVINFLSHARGKAYLFEEEPSSISTLEPQNKQKGIGLTFMGSMGLLYHMTPSIDLTLRSSYQKLSMRTDYSEEFQQQAHAVTLKVGLRTYF